MKHGEGFVDSPSMRHRISKVRRMLEGEPVGGAPSRSGFLATPINASSRRTFSVDDTASREKRCRVGRLVCAFSEVRERISKKNRRGTEGNQEKERRRAQKEPAKAPCRELRHGECFNGCEGTRFDSHAQRRR